jgi:hypothetical protein
VLAFLIAGVTLGGERAASSAPAARTSVRLAYVRESGAEQCPDESVLRDSVLTRLGYDPFDDRAPRLLVAVVRRSGDSLVARIELHDASGRVQGERDLRGSGTSCDELASAMAIALSLGIDPLSATAAPPNRADSSAAPASAPSVESQPPPPRVIVEPRAPEPSSPPAREPPIRARFSGGALVSWGVSPATPAIGATLDAGMRRGRWSIDVEGAGSWAPTATEGSIGAKSSLELVSLVPCVHFWVGLGCAIGGGGSLNATGVDVRFPQSDHAAFANVGVRLGVEIPFAERFYLQFHADGLAILTPETFHLDGQTVWRSSPPVSASLGLAVGVVP